MFILHKNNISCFGSKKTANYFIRSKMMFKTFDVIKVSIIFPGKVTKKLW